MLLAVDSLHAHALMLNELRDRHARQPYHDQVIADRIANDYSSQANWEVSQVKWKQLFAELNAEFGIYWNPPKAVAKPIVGGKKRKPKKGKGSFKRVKFDNFDLEAGHELDIPALDITPAQLAFVSENLDFLDLTRGGCYFVGPRYDRQLTQDDWRTLELLMEHPEYCAPDARRIDGTFGDMLVDDIDQAIEDTEMWRWECEQQACGWISLEHDLDAAWDAHSGYRRELRLELSGKTVLITENGPRNSGQHPLVGTIADEVNYYHTIREHYANDVLRRWVEVSESYWGNAADIEYREWFEAEVHPSWETEQAIDEADALDELLQPIAKHLLPACEDDCEDDCDDETDLEPDWDRWVARRA